MVEAKTPGILTRCRLRASGARARRVLLRGRPATRRRPSTGVNSVLVVSCPSEANSLCLPRTVNELRWKTQNRNDRLDFFFWATSFNQPLNNWNVSNVMDMRWMFEVARSFNQPLNNWNVSKVGVMDSMFGRATSFNQPLHAPWYHADSPSTSSESE